MLDILELLWYVVATEDKCKEVLAKEVGMNIIEITPTPRARGEKIRLASYVRVSSDSKDQLHSYAAQIQYYSEYVRNHPQYQLVDIYADEGITGTEMDCRDDLNRLLRDCQKGKIDRITTKSIARFARNTEELLMMLRMLKLQGVSVYFEEQDIDTEKQNMEMIVTFPGMAAQQESEAISGNLRWSYKKRMESGDFNCTRPAYGFELMDGEMTVKEDEAKVVRRIFDLYLQGNGIQTIADILNEEKVERRNKNVKWLCRSVRYILSNERYKGDALLQKTYGTDCIPFRRKHNNGERRQYYVENSNPPIVSVGIFDKVQELLRTRSTPNCQRHPRNIITGIIRCPKCGGVFRRRVINEKAYWVCAKSEAGIEKNCGERVREDMIYDTFMEMLYKVKGNIDRIITPLIKQLIRLNERTNENQGIINRIDKEIADLSAKNLVVTRLHTNGVLSAADFALQTSEINRRLLELRRERRKKLNENEDGTIDELQCLYDAVQEVQLTGGFDEEIFGEIVEKIIIKDRKAIIFCLIGGLQLTEAIKEKGRCNRK